MNPAQVVDAACPICRSSGSEPYPTPDPTPVRRCRSCGARWVWPIPTDAELRERYRAEHERGEWSRRFEGTATEEWARRSAIVTERAGTALGGTSHGRTSHGGDGESDPRPLVLDVGCGDGRFLDAMAAAGWRTVGTEIALPGARLAAGRHPVVVGELAALHRGPLFHAVTLWDVLEHLPDPRGVVREVSTRLRPGGVVAISMPNLGGTASVVLGRRWPYYRFGHYGHLHHLSPLHLERLLEGEGLSPIFRETRGSVDLRDAPAAYGFAPPSRPTAWLLDRLSGLLARTAEPLGRGNTIVLVGRKNRGESS